MRIEFDPTNRDEATAVRAVLAALHPATGGLVTSTETRVVGEIPSEQTIPVSARIDPSVGQTLYVQDTETVPDVDSNGEPWDARIHSTPAKTNADGTWRAKRGVTADVVAAVRAEREQAHTVTTSDGAGMTVTENLETGERTVSVEAEQFVIRRSGDSVLPNEPETKTLDVPPAIREIVAEVMSEAPKAPTPPAPAQEQTAPQPPPAPVVEVNNGPARAVLPDAPSFLDVMKAITAAQKDGKIDTAKVKELCAAVGAGDSTLGLNGADKAEVRSAFMALLGETGE